MEFCCTCAWLDLAHTFPEVHSSDIPSNQGPERKNTITRVCTPYAAEVRKQF